MDNLGVHSRLEETFPLKRTDVTATRTNGRPTGSPDFDWPGNDRAAAGPNPGSFQQSLDEVRREKQLQDARR